MGCFSTLWCDVEDRPLVAAYQHERTSPFAARFSETPIRRGNDCPYCTGVQFLDWASQPFVAQDCKPRSPVNGIARDFPRAVKHASKCVELAAQNSEALTGRTLMRILLYNPDNGVTRNFMPHLWMFLLQALTPPGHEVVLIDGNAQPMDEAQIAQFVQDQNIGMVGIGAMTRMVAKAYRMADDTRATGVPVVMGGPHVTEEADEALGRNGGPRHADAVALGEADETWPQIVEDAV